MAAGPLVARVRHAITFRRIRVDVHAARLRREPPSDGERYAWVQPQSLALPVSSLTRKILHANDPLLVAQLAGSSRVWVGDGWRFARKGGVGHVDAVYALAGAVHLARNLPAAVGKPRLVVAG